VVVNMGVAGAPLDDCPALGPGDALGHPDSPDCGAMLVSTASAIEAYAVWVASPGQSADRQQLSEAIRVADQTSGRAVARAQRRWHDDPAQWLTFGTILTMSHRILAEVSSPLEPPDQAA
jgi:hypothetical protein